MLVESKQLVGMFLVVVARKRHYRHIKNVQISIATTGFFFFFLTQFGFVSHLFILSSPNTNKTNLKKQGLWVLWGTKEVFLFDFLFTIALFVLSTHI